MQFAQAITLGAAIGDTTFKAAQNTVLPLLEQSVAPEYKKWCGPVLNYAIKSVAVSIAWFIQRVISCLHTSTRGAEMLLTGVAAFCKQKDISLPAAMDPESNTFQTLCMGLAVMGFLWQLWCGFGLIFPLNILLLPATLFESFLVLWVAY